MAILCTDYPDLLIACHKATPLVLGVGEGENFISSDVSALLGYTRKFIYVKDNDLCLLTREGITIKNPAGEVITPEIKEISWSADAAEKNGYEHYMLKEINEQPIVFRRMLEKRVNDGRFRLKNLLGKKSKRRNGTKSILSPAVRRIIPDWSGAQCLKNWRKFRSRSRSPASSAIASRCSTEILWLSRSANQARLPTLKLL